MELTGAASCREKDRQTAWCYVLEGSCLHKRIGLRDHLYFKIIFVQNVLFVREVPNARHRSLMLNDYISAVVLYYGCCISAQPIWCKFSVFLILSQHILC
jgi:hypothetical protein